jgi:hypothetical protein
VKSGADRLHAAWPAIRKLISTFLVGKIVFLGPRAKHALAVLVSDKLPVMAEKISQMAAYAACPCRREQGLLESGQAIRGIVALLPPQPVSCPTRMTWIDC